MKQRIHASFLYHFLHLKGNNFLYHYKILLPFYQMYQEFFHYFHLITINISLIGFILMTIIIIITFHRSKIIRNMVFLMN